MNILELCLSGGFGGLELYALKSVKELKKTDNNIKIIVRNNTFLDEKLEESELSRDYLHPIVTNFPFITAWRLAGYLSTYSIDVMHIHWGHDLLLAIMAKFLSRKKIKLVYTRQMALTRMKHDPYHKFVYKNVDAYVVIAQALYNDARRYLPLRSGCLHLLYYGVPSPVRDMNICKKYLAENQIEPETFKIAIFGRIEHGKGQYLLVEAVRKILKEGKKIQAAMIGHVMDEEYFNKLAKEIKDAGLEEQIRYLGFHNNPVSIMGCFDVVVLASKCETFGLVLPEAMRAGVAVIGSNCGGVPEIISHGKTGLLFESENVEDLTNRLRELIDDPALCQKLAKAGKTEADERFSEEKHFQRLIEIFRNA
jgi:glycosyltransferase involved in cell wall biosynthesis